MRIRAQNRHSMRRAKVGAGILSKDDVRIQPRPATKSSRWRLTSLDGALWETNSLTFPDVSDLFKDANARLLAFSSSRSRTGGRSDRPLLWVARARRSNAAQMSLASPRTIPRCSTSSPRFSSICTTSGRSRSVAICRKRRRRPSTTWSSTSRTTTECFWR